MQQPQRYSIWWRGWLVDGVDLDSVEGYLLTCDFEDDGRPIVHAISGLRPGDPDPRDASWIIERIDSVVDSEGVPGMPYLHLIRADGTPVDDHPYGWAHCYPLVATDTDLALEMVHVTHGTNLPINFRAEVSIREP